MVMANVAMDEFDDFGEFDDGANSDIFQGFDGNAKDDWGGFETGDVGAETIAVQTQELSVSSHELAARSGIIDETVALVLEHGEMRLSEHCLALLCDAYPAAPAGGLANERQAEDQWRAGMFTPTGSLQLCESVLKVKGKRLLLLAN